MTGMPGLDAILLVIALVLLVSLQKRVGRLHGEVQSLSERMHGLRRQLESLRGRPSDGMPSGDSLPAPGVTPTPEPPPATPAVPAPHPPRPVGATPPPLRLPVPPARPLPPLASAPVASDASPAAPAPARPRSRLAESAGEVLRKIWNWILVGDEHRPKGVTAEYAIATTWTLRLGILLVVLGMIYVLIWSAQKELVSPVGRVALVLLAGVGMLVAGIRLLGKKYHLLGQGLMGGGIVVLYSGIYAMGPRYGLVPTPAAFALMGLVTVAAGILALRLNSLLVAILGLAGGYLTPALIRTPTPNLAVFYAYLLLLGLAILALAWRKQWRLLNYLSFACTYTLFLSAMGAYHPARDFPLAMGFLIAFFVIQSSLVIVYNIARRQRSTTLEVIHLAANALLAAAIGYGLVVQAHGRPYPAFLSLGLAAFFTAHVLALIQRRSEDRKLVVAMIALAGGFATWTLPLIMERESLTIALALLAFTFLWLGHKMNSRFLQNLANGLYVLVAFRLMTWDFRRDYSTSPDPNMPWREYARLLLNHLWTFGLSIGSFVAAFILQQRLPKPAPSMSLPSAADTPLLLSSRLMNRALYWAALVMVFIFLNAEFSTMFLYAPPWRLPVLTVIWCAFAVYFLRAHRAEDHPGAMFWAMTAVLVAAVVKVLGLDLAFWHCGLNLVCDDSYRPLHALARLLDFGMLLAAFLIVWRSVRGRDATRASAPFFGYGALLLLFLYGTLEWNTFLHWTLRRFQEGGLSILWALFAIAYLIAGITRNIPLLRYLGLALLAIVMGKVFFFDLSNMVVIVRVVAFFAVGVILLIGSFVYTYSSKTFSKHE